MRIRKRGGTLFPSPFQESSEGDPLICVDDVAVLSILREAQKELGIKGKWRCEPQRKSGAERRLISLVEAVLLRAW